MPRLLDGGNVGGFLDHADELLITSSTAAVAAGIDIGDVIADRAQAQLGLDVSNRGGESFGVIFARAQNMEAEALRTLATDSRQFLEFVDQPGHGFGKARHFSYSPPRPSPPSIPPTLDCIAWSTLRPASLSAAITRSCSISTS